MSKIVNDLYSKYLNERIELDKKFRQDILSIKNKIIEDCPLKKGMIIKFNKWVGRIKDVSFIGIDDNQYIKIVIIDSRTTVTIDFKEEEFDKIEILEEPSDLDIESINKYVELLKQEELNLKNNIERLNRKHGNKILEIEEKLKTLRSNCIHDWKISSDGTQYICTICDDSRPTHKF
jgi:hypothetical protein